MPRGQGERLRAALAARLAERREEIEREILTRVFAIADPGEATDPTYAEALPIAVAAALDHGIEGVRRGEEASLAPPPVLLTQARLAARARVDLHTVYRRYFAGYVLLTDFLVEEARRSELRGGDLRRLLRGQAALFERLLNVVEEEYGREGQSRPASPERRRAECAERLLAGEPVDPSPLAYDFERWHLGAIATGEKAQEAVKRSLGDCDCQLLLIPREEESVWAWIGSRRGLDPAELVRGAGAHTDRRTTLAIGEPGWGLAGWRLTHRQAQAVASLAQGKGGVVRYADVALLASIQRDELLSASLRQLYLDPLEEERDGGEVARATLRAYFAAGRNVSSAAAALGVNRNTVANRLAAIEERIGRPIAACAAEMEAALRLGELGEADRRGSLAARLIAPVVP